MTSLKKTEPVNAHSRPCENCRGSGEVNRVIFGEQPQTLKMFGKTLPLIGSILIEACRVCGGTGAVNRLSEFRAWLESCEEITDDSRVSAYCPHTPEEIVAFIGRLTRKRETDLRRTVPIDIEVIVLPVDQGFHSAGELFKASAREVSIRGIGLVHDAPVYSHFLLMQIVTVDFETVQLATQILKHEEVDDSYRSWCEFLVA